MILYPSGVGRSELGSGLEDDHHHIIYSSSDKSRGDDHHRIIMSSSDQSISS